MEPSPSVAFSFRAFAGLGGDLWLPGDADVLGDGDADAKLHALDVEITDAQPGAVALGNALAVCDAVALADWRAFAVPFAVSLAVGQRFGQRQPERHGHTELIKECLALAEFVRERIAIADALCHGHGDADGDAHPLCNAKSDAHAQRHAELDPLGEPGGDGLRDGDAEPEPDAH